MPWDLKKKDHKKETVTATASVSLKRGKKISTKTSNLYLLVNGVSQSLCNQKEVPKKSQFRQNMTLNLF